jgi:hypothetical protein
MSSFSTTSLKTNGTYSATLVLAENIRLTQISIQMCYNGNRDDLSEEKEAEIYVNDVLIGTGQFSGGKYVDENKKTQYEYTTITIVADMEISHEEMLKVTVKNVSDVSALLVLETPDAVEWEKNVVCRTATKQLYIRCDYSVINPVWKMGEYPYLQEEVADGFKIYWDKLGYNLWKIDEEKVIEDGYPYFVSDSSNDIKKYSVYIKQEDNTLIQAVVMFKADTEDGTTALTPAYFTGF